MEPQNEPEKEKKPKAEPKTPTEGEKKLRANLQKTLAEIDDLSPEDREIIGTAHLNAYRLGFRDGIALAERYAKPKEPEKKKSFWET